MTCAQCGNYGIFFSLSLCTKLYIQTQSIKKNRSLSRESSLGEYFVKLIHFLLLHNLMISRKFFKLILFSSWSTYSWLLHYFIFAGNILSTSNVFFLKINTSLWYRTNKKNWIKIGTEMAKLANYQINFTKKNFKRFRSISQKIHFVVSVCFFSRWDQ